jgi:hypothetical protein
MDTPIGTILLPLVIVVGIVAYYVFVMRRARAVGGGSAYGLAPGEGVQAMYGGRLLRDATSPVAALLGGNKDEQVTVTVTTAGRLVIASPTGAMQPIAFGPGARPDTDVVGNVNYTDGRQYLLAGMSGMEPARVLRIAPKGTEALRLILPDTGAQQIAAWARG